MAILPTHALSRTRELSWFSWISGRHLTKPFILFVVLCICINFYLLPYPCSQRPRPRSPMSGPLARPAPEHLPAAAPSQDVLWSKHASSVKDAFLHAYGGYERYTTYPDEDPKAMSGIICNPPFLSPTRHLPYVSDILCRKIRTSRVFPSWFICSR
ncbi:hypothetical protein F5888DRAFT_1736805 [Russula emetica]|nr:hypothetical protein F5888DRAFT_1736805 [Russula emetica]